MAWYGVGYCRSCKTASGGDLFAERGFTIGKDGEENIAAGHSPYRTNKIT
jgi:hypothetical protein